MARSASPLLPLGLTQLPTSLLLQNERHRQVAGRLKKRLANAKHNPAHNAKNRENGKSRLANAKTNAKHNAKNRAKNSARRVAQQALRGVPV